MLPRVARPVFPSSASNRLGAYVRFRSASTTAIRRRRSAGNEGDVVDPKIERRASTDGKLQRKQRMRIEGQGTTVAPLSQFFPAHLVRLPVGGELSIDAVAVVAIVDAAAAELFGDDLRHLHCHPQLRSPTRPEAHAGVS